MKNVHVCVAAYIMISSYVTHPEHPYKKPSLSSQRPKLDGRHQKVIGPSVLQRARISLK